MVKQLPSLGKQQLMIKLPQDLLDCGLTSPRWVSGILERPKTPRVLHLFDRHREADALKREQLKVALKPRVFDLAVRAPTKIRQEAMGLRPSENLVLALGCKDRLRAKASHGRSWSTSMLTTKKQGLR